VPSVPQLIVEPVERRAVNQEPRPTQAPKIVSVAPRTYRITLDVKLPAEGQQIVQTYDADVTAIYKEIEAKVEVRRQATIKSLEALQDQLAKAGKLDEAVAIRDYLRSGGPAAIAPTSSFSRYSPVKKGGR
jgi:hypothetical protein